MGTVGNTDFSLFLHVNQRKLIAYGIYLYMLQIYMCIYNAIRQCNQVRIKDRKNRTALSTSVLLPW